MKEKGTDTLDTGFRARPGGPVRIGRRPAHALAALWAAAVLLAVAACGDSTSSEAWPALDADSPAHTKAWGAPVLLSTGAGDAYDPQIAMDGAGTAVAVWEQWNGPDLVIRANRFNGAAWDPPVLLYTGTGTARDPQIGQRGTPRQRGTPIKI